MNKTVPPAVALDRRIDAYVSAYCFRGDDGDRTPTDDERLLIFDAIHGFMVEVGAVQPTLVAPPEWSQWYEAGFRAGGVAMREVAAIACDQRRPIIAMSPEEKLIYKMLGEMGEEIRALPIPEQK